MLHSCSCPNLLNLLLLLLYFFLLFHLLHYTPLASLLFCPIGFSISFLFLYYYCYHLVFYIFHTLHSMSAYVYLCFLFVPLPAPFLSLLSHIFLYKTLRIFLHYISSF